MGRNNRGMLWARDSDPIGRLVKESRFIELRGNCGSHASPALAKQTKLLFNDGPLQSLGFVSFFPSTSQLTNPLAYFFFVFSCTRVCLLYKRNAMTISVSHVWNSLLCCSCAVPGLGLKQFWLALLVVFILLKIAETSKEQTLSDTTPSDVWMDVHSKKWSRLLPNTRQVLIQSGGRKVSLRSRIG